MYSAAAIDRLKNQTSRVGVSSHGWTFGVSLKVLALLFIAMLGGGSVQAADADLSDSGQEVLEKYLSATQEQQQSLRGVSMEVDIDAEVPKLKKQGKLHALRNISKLGTVTYRMLGFNGDNSVKTEVIARYLTAESQAQTGPDISITPANYKFKLKGREQRGDREVYVFHVSPRKKRVGLFKGELWIDPQTYLPVLETGRFVKSPSIFLKKMEFVRTYDIENGVAIPQRLETRVDTRIFGPVQLSINFTHFTKAAGDTVATASSDNQ